MRYACSVVTYQTKSGNTIDINRLISMVTRDSNCQKTNKRKCIYEEQQSVVLHHLVLLVLSQSTQFDGSNEGSLVSQFDGCG